MKTAAIILSGGSGTRFGADIPKQYIKVKGRSILSYTIEAFKKSSADEIVIVAAEEDVQLCWQIALGSRAGGEGHDPQNAPGLRLEQVTPGQLSMMEQAGHAGKVKAVITGGKERKRLKPKMWHRLMRRLSRFFTSPRRNSKI